MCGLVALIAFDGSLADPRVIERMAAAIAHRGPDEGATYVEGPVGFGFRRLSILDLSPTGHQPMVTEDGQVVIVFNGEIYNYIELRTELEALGHRFRSTGDTEVLLRAYCQWGTDCLSRLNGMWAFLIYDRRRGVVFGARDRFGVKPLFLHHAKNHIVFASEIKALKVSGVYDPKPNLQAVSRFLVGGTLDGTEQTFFAGIEQLPAGNALEVDLHGRTRQWRYWSLDTVHAQTVADPAAAFAELFEDAIRLHMRSDVPVAVHLSGGLDSTSIVCSSARIRNAANARDALLAFCYMPDEFDERRYVADTAAQSGARLIPLETKPESFWDDLREVLCFQDEPVHSFTPVVGYQLMRLTKENGIRVVLNGQGADETIGGYGNYFRHYWYSLLQEGRLREVWKEVGEFSRVHTKRGTIPVMLGELAFWARSLTSRLPEYRRLAAWRGRVRRSANKWFGPELRDAYVEAEPAYGGADLGSVLKDSMTRMPLPLYLRIEDRNSMAHSIEARVPFLDYRLVSLLLSLSPNWKLRGPWNKFVLREAMRGRIPESVRTRLDKMGFPVPTSLLLRGKLFEPVMDLLGSREARERGLYDTRLIRRDAERYRRGEIDVGGHLFDLVSTELWFQLNWGPDAVSLPQPRLCAAVR